MRRAVNPRSAAFPVASSLAPRARFYSTEKADKQAVDLAKIPIKAIGVLGDFYVPPRFLSCPVTSWPKLLLRRIGAFGTNTFAVTKYKTDTKLKLHFNEWKELAVDKYVKTNKIFAAACSLPRAQRASYLQTQLDGIAGMEVVNSLAKRVATFPAGLKLQWNLLGVESNPRLVSFIPIPDSSDVTFLVQFTVQVKTKQEMVVTGVGADDQRTEKVVTDYIVMTLNPYTDEMAFVGTLFESDHIRGVKPELDFLARGVMDRFQKECADIYRAAPAKL